MAQNTLYYGVNLGILRESIADNSVDLIYIDPPFNSKKAYNVIFPEPDGSASEAQRQAFGDTWHWTEQTEQTYLQIIQMAPPRIVECIKSFRSFLHEMDLMAYLVMMTVRLVELHRVLKQTGSFYLHCDPTASHYLKVILDQIFGIKRLRNEIVWCYTRPSNAKKQYPRVHHIIFFYTKGDKWTFNRDADAVRIQYHPESKARSLRGAGTKSAMGNKGKDRLHPKGKIREDWWHIPELQGNAMERLGYPTQKPEALLEPIIAGSSNEGDIVLDAFCGCGTAIVVAERQKRRWIGIDITHLAITLIKNRLDDTFGNSVDYIVERDPQDLSGAHELALEDRYQFEYWALGLIMARPIDQKKKGADRGIDGVKYINATGSSGKENVITMLVQVKSGHIGVRDIREFKAVVNSNKAEMGVFLTLKNPTDPMIKEALADGYYSPGSAVATKHQKIQILTIEELLNGKKLDAPYHDDMTYKKAKREEIQEDAEQPRLL